MRDKILKLEDLPQSIKTKEQLIIEEIAFLAREALASLPKVKIKRGRKSIFSGYDKSKTKKVYKNLLSCFKEMKDNVRYNKHFKDSSPHKKAIEIMARKMGVSPSGLKDFLFKKPRK